MFQLSGFYYKPSRPKALKRDRLNPKLKTQLHSTLSV